MNIKKILVSSAAGALMFGSLAVGAFADSVSVNFENPPYILGDIHGQDGWSKTGPYDVEVILNSYGYGSLGSQTLRISDAIVSGSFGDQTFSKSLIDEAGESLSSDAFNGGMSGGTRQPYFEASWDFASTVPGAEQPGLSVVASPDRGDGARMSWVQMTDTTGGIDVNFYDYQTGLGFVPTPVIADLDRTVVHNIKITMEFVDGPANDIVKVYVDGVLRHTGTSWEDYFRENQPPGTRTVDSILFRTSVASDSLGEGFLIDNLSLMSGMVPVVFTTPSDKNECKKDGWKTFNNPTFKNQGQCVSFVQSNEHAGKRLMIFTASNSQYYNGPTSAAPLYGDGAISFTWDAVSGNVTEGYYNEVVPATTGTTYYNVVTGGTVSGTNVNLTFTRTNPNNYGPFTFTGTLVGNVLTGTLDGPYLFTATGN